MSFTKCIWVSCICFLDWDDVPPSCALEEISEEEAVQIIAEPILPLQSSTLRDYVDHSETLAKLVHLGMCVWVGFVLVGLFVLMWFAYVWSFGDSIIYILILPVALQT